MWDYQISSLIFVLTTKNFTHFFLISLRSELTSFVSVLFPSCTVIIPDIPANHLLNENIFPQVFNSFHPWGNFKWIWRLWKPQLKEIKTLAFRKLFYSHLRKSVLISNISKKTNFSVCRHFTLRLHQWTCLLWENKFRDLKIKLMKLFPACNSTVFFSFFSYKRAREKKHKSLLNPFDHF